MYVRLVPFSQALLATILFVPPFPPLSAAAFRGGASVSEDHDVVEVLFVVFCSVLEGTSAGSSYALPCERLKLLYCEVSSY